MKKYDSAFTVYIQANNKTNMFSIMVINTKFRFTTLKKYNKHDRENEDEEQQKQNSKLIQSGADSDPPANTIKCHIDLR